MAWRVSWLAVKGREQADVFSALGLEETGEMVGDSLRPFATCQTPTGWLLILSNKFDYVVPSRLALVSKNAEAIGVHADDDYLLSEIRVFRDGVEVWMLGHDGEKDVGKTTTAGTPPDWLPEIIARLQAETDADDDPEFKVDFVYDAPFEAAMRICGFRHDEGCEGMEDYPDMFELTPIGQPRAPIPTRTPPQPRKSGGGFLSWLFGRR